MSDESNIDDEETPESGGMAEVIEDAVSGVPAPIRKNAWKAFSQLCTAAVDIPVAHLEGAANEKRAESAARVKLIETSADSIAKKMDMNPEYARIAVKKYGEKILKEQINLDVISQQAAKELEHDQSSSSNQDTVGDISEDWLNIFEKEASTKSSAEMRNLFGKILAGEIRKPSTYSIKTVKLISELDNKAASLFQKYCSLSLSLYAGSQLMDVRVPSLGGNAGSNSLQSHGLNFAHLNILHEYGLIISDYNSYMDYDMCITRPDGQLALPFNYQSLRYKLTPMEKRDKPSKLKLHGVGLSQSGKELYGIIDKEPAGSFTIELQKFFESQKYKMERVI